MKLVEAPIVYQDLQDANLKLSQELESPRNVRRCFSRYVELSQKLTSAMRKDFSSAGKKWQASDFKAWSTRTDLLKHLRNEEQHNLQIFLHVTEKRQFELPDNVEVPGMPRQFQVINTWLITDQLLEEPPTGLEIGLTDPGKPAHEERELLAPTSIERTYVIAPRSAETKRFLDRAGMADVHFIAKDTMNTFSNYYKYFIEQADAE